METKVHKLYQTYEALLEWYNAWYCAPTTTYRWYKHQKLDTETYHYFRHRRKRLTR